MITPNFELDQTDEYLIIKIKARFANVNQTIIDVNRTEFIFSSSPYFLRLHLPGEVTETDSSSGSYDWDFSIFTIKLNKVNPGEHFPDLNLINKFLTPIKRSKINPSIEILNQNSNTDNDDDEDSDIDCSFLQKPLSLENSICTKYGFGNQIQTAFSSFYDEFFEIVDFKNANDLNSNERKCLQMEKEISDFRYEHYLADFMETPYEIQAILKFKPFWFGTDYSLNDSQKSVLKSFGNKEYLLSKEEKKSALFSLVDIIYAYCYNIRVNVEEENSESAWLINKLSSTLSWFRNFETFDDLVQSCVRRSLCYPLYRVWELSILVISDVSKVFGNGCICLLTCLLDIYNMFNLSEPRYVLNQLYIKDYCIWIQQLKSKHFDTISKFLSDIKIEKELIQLDLNELEIAAISLDEEIKTYEEIKTDEEIDTDEEIETYEQSSHINIKNIDYDMQQLQISNDQNNLDSDDDEEE